MGWNAFEYFSLSFIHRNSHVVIPYIIKFLFYLSKQKEKTLITIPKIINVTDTLLANSVTQNGYIEALRELAYEFYVRQSIGDADANDLTPTAAKELNTQKEVAFSMLLKFIEKPMVRAAPSSIDRSIDSLILIFRSKK